MGSLKTTFVVVAVAVTIAALAASSVAFATTSGTDSASGTRVRGEIPSGQAIKPDRSGGQEAAAPGALRLTGLDLTLILGGGIVLVASGVALSGLVLRRVRV
jgi:hypothetical protein